MTENVTPAYLVVLIEGVAACMMIVQMRRRRLHPLLCQVARVREHASTE